MNTWRSQGVRSSWAAPVNGGGPTASAFSAFSYGANWSTMARRQAAFTVAAVAGEAVETTPCRCGRHRPVPGNRLRSVPDFEKRLDRLRDLRHCGRSRRRFAALFRLVPRRQPLFVSSFGLRSFSASAALPCGERVAAGRDGMAVVATLVDDQAFAEVHPRLAAVAVSRTRPPRRRRLSTRLNAASILLARRCPPQVRARSRRRPPLTQEAGEILASLSCKQHVRHPAARFDRQRIPADRRPAVPASSCCPGRSAGSGPGRRR